MKTLFKPLAFIFLMLTMVACSKSDDVDLIEDEGIRPIVDFDIVPGDDPFTFSFTNKTSNYKDLVWRFGDDSVAYESSPTHLYKTTGKFQVTLTATSETGITSQKLLEINIDPEKVVKVTAGKTAVANQVKFNLDATAEIASVLWTFENGTTSTALDPTRTYGTGTLNPFKLKVTTKKGSVINFDKFGTTEGVVANVTNQRIGFSVSSDNSGGPSANEGSLKLVDGNVDTKMYQGWPSGGFRAVIEFAGSEKIKFYGIGSANDSDTRDPKNWTLEGSDDNITWEVLDTRAQTSTFYAQAGNKWKQMFYFAVTNQKAYKYYRYNVTANFGSSGFQFSEIRLYK